MSSRSSRRYRLQDKGKTLEVQYTMTDPKNWKGEWHNTKHFIREDYSDVPEVECLPNLNANLPSTEKGHDAAEHQDSGAKPRGRIAAGRQVGAAPLRETRPPWPSGRS